VDDPGGRPNETFAPSAKTSPAVANARSLNEVSWPRPFVNPGQLVRGVTARCALIIRRTMSKPSFLIPSSSMASFFGWRAPTPSS
jgi:hypothetical protein